jgi:hypothetical protein
MAHHEATVGLSDEWYTPPFVFEALGEYFDLDVASPGPAVVPWVPADFHYVSRGLERPWFGFVWMNPPFGGRNGYDPWGQRFVKHGNGIAVSPVRTGAAWCQRLMAGSDAILFWSPKIRFWTPDGDTAGNPGYATMLCAAGPRAIAALERAARFGVLMKPAS